MLSKVKNLVYDTILYIKRAIAYIAWAKMPIDNNKIVVDNFLGKGFGDNPKYIIESLHLTNPNVKIVWLLKDMTQIMPPYIKKVKYASLNALYEYETARIWIDNVRNSVHPFTKKKNQYYLQTWHGTLPFKRIEGQSESLNERYIRSAKKDSRMCDAILSSNSALSKIMQDYFWLNGRNEKIIEYGSPETDPFFDKQLSIDVRRKVREYYGVAEDALIILYMPTFRDNMSVDVYTLDYERVRRQFEAKTGKKCYIMVRLHPNIKSDSFIQFSDCVLSSSKYPDANELLIASDWLLSDYSSVIYLSVLLFKPAILFTPDILEYSSNRGLSSLYYDLPCPMVMSENDLLDAIEQFDTKIYTNECAKYKERVVPFCLGCSSSILAKHINGIIDSCAV